jgi:hypothetical protein
MHHDKYHKEGGEGGEGVGDYFGMKSDLIGFSLI